MNIVFLDYDGVVNTPIFEFGEEDERFYFPYDNRVNNYQACRWLSKLCLKTNSKIVVTSTWRLYPNYRQCLYNGGLDSSIEIIGKTKYRHGERTRGAEIYDFIRPIQHDIEHIVILDDEDVDMYEKYLVKCKTMVGFTYYEYAEALEKLIAIKFTG